MNVQNYLLDEIKYINLTYFLLLQKMSVVEDTTCLARLGIAEELFQKIRELTIEQVITITDTNQLMLKPRFENPEQINILTKESRVSKIKNLHSSIMLISGLE